MTDRIRVLKGHGTGNDFVIVPDLQGHLDLTPGMVQAVCDRRFGLGADGVLRVVRSANCEDPDAVGAEFFMDYRNADGSSARMCGNGIRVFAHFLVSEGLANPTDVPIATRGGVRHVRRLADGDYAVKMGSATGIIGHASVQVANRSYPAVGVHVPNPHAVAFVGSLDAAGTLTQAPEVSPAAMFPEGVNVEFVTEVGPAHIAMRVHERGVGETQSCGTGACAAAWAARRRPGASVDATYRVDVPGGTLRVSEADGMLELIGPAVVVADGLLDVDWAASWR